MWRAGSTALTLVALGLVLPLLVGTARAEDSVSSSVGSYGGNFTDSGDAFLEPEVLEPVPLPPPPPINASDAMENVIELDENNFNASLASHSHMMVFFYAPDCEHSALLAPNWASVANRLQLDPTVLPASVALAKINIGTSYFSETPFKVPMPHFLEHFLLGGTPSVRWIVNDNSSIYDAGNTDQEILDFLRGHFGLPPLPIELPDEDTAANTTQVRSIAVDQHASEATVHGGEEVML